MTTAKRLTRAELTSMLRSAGLVVALADLDSEAGMAGDIVRLGDELKRAWDALEKYQWMTGRDHNGMEDCIECQHFEADGKHAPGCAYAAALPPPDEESACVCGHSRGEHSNDGRACLTRKMRCQCPGYAQEPTNGR